MEEVKVKVSDLLIKLRENRETHRKTFEIAIDGYRNMVIEQLEKSIADAKANKEIRTSLGLIAPHDHTSDYDMAIKMLEMCVDNEIIITDDEFRNFVMDEWSWSKQFLSSSTSYSTSSSISA